MNAHDPYFSIAAGRLIEAQQAALSHDTARNTPEATVTSPVEPEVRRLARALRDNMPMRTFVG